MSLVLNKTDLLPPEELAATLAQAADWGYDALPVCAATGDGLAELAERLAGRVTVLAGPSGVSSRFSINYVQMRHDLADNIFSSCGICCAWHETVVVRIQRGRGKQVTHGRHAWC